MSKLEKIGSHHIGFDMFATPKMKLYAEGDAGSIDNVEVKVDGNGDATVAVDGAEGDTAEVTVAAQGEAPKVELELPTDPEAGQIENIEVAIEYAEKCAKYVESLTDAIEAGAAVVVDGTNGTLNVGPVEVMPESENKADGVVSFADMNEERIDTGDQTAQTDDGTFAVSQ